MRNPLMEKALATQARVPKREWNMQQEDVLIAWLDRRLTQRQVSAALGIPTTSVFQAIGGYLVSTYREGRITIHPRKEDAPSTR